MSRPEIPKRDREEVLVDLLESIALEETALANFINAEAEKTQRIIVDCDTTPREIISFQKNMSKVMKNVIKKEMLLQFKLEEVLDAKLESKDK